MRSATPPPSARRRIWPLFVVLGLLAALAAAWTGLWFHFAAQAKAEFASWRERERQAGRQQDCASLSVAGYPLRIELHCTGGRFEVEGSPPVRIALPSIAAGVQVYDPGLLLADLTAPLNISGGSGQPEYVLDWRAGRASVRGLPSQAERGSVAFDAFAVRDSAGSDSPIFQARHFQMEARQVRGGIGNGDAEIEAVLKLKDAILQGLPPAAARPMDADISGVLSGVGELSPKPLPLILREWQARNGTLEIMKGRVQQDDVIAEGTGTLKLTRSGGLDGNLQITVVGIENILKMFNIEQMMSEGQIGAALNTLDQLIPGLGLGGLARKSAAPSLAATLGQPSELDGKPARTLPLRFVDGAVFLGAMPVGVVPPLF
jgi:hypothetical protein